MFEGVDLSKVWRSINSLSSWSSRFGTYVYGRFSDLKSDINGLIDDVYSVQKSIRDIKDWVHNTIQDAQNALISTVREDMIKPLSAYVDALQMDVRDWIDTLRQDITDIYEGLNTIFEFINEIDAIIDARVDGFKDKIVMWIEDKFISIVEHVLEQEVKE